MSMILALQSLSDANIAKVLADPPLIWRVLAPDDPDVYLDMTRAAGSRGGFWARLFGKKPAPAPVESPALDFQDGEGESTDLDKAWHGLHYLFTQTDWAGEPPLNFIVCGGTEVGDVDVGYGPARVFRAQEVQAIHTALQATDPDTLRNRFDPDAMMKLDIYPTIWDRDAQEDDTLAYCLEYFDVLKDFIADAARHELGLVVYLS